MASETTAKKKIASLLSGAPKGGDLPRGLLSKGSMSSYTPTMREKIAGLLAKNWYGDTREGYRQAEKLVNVGETVVPPLGLLSGSYDAGRALGGGNMMQAGVLGGLAMLPLPGAAKKQFKVTRKLARSGVNSEDFELRPDLMNNYTSPAMVHNGKVYERQQGEYNHADIAQRVGFPEGIKPGFVTPEGEFHYQFPEDVLSEIESAWKSKGVDLSLLYSKDGTIELSKIVVPKEMRGAGIGSAVMADLNNFADQTGSRIVLSPSTDFGGSSVERLKTFYKRHGFVENAGRNKDFTTRATMYRQSTKDSK